MKYRFFSWLNEVWYSYLRLIFSVVYFFISSVLWFFGMKNKAVIFLMQAIRYGSSGRMILFLRNILLSGVDLTPKISGGVEVGEAAARSIVVKWPTYKEGSISKGVLIITFTKTFSYYLKHINLEKMQEHFVFVLEPSWSGYADPDILGFYGKLKNIVVASSELDDRVFLNCFPETFIPVSFGASDWVDSNIFFESDEEKIYDSIYIANTNPIKRIKRYLDAINNIVKSGANDYVGCLVCASWGGAEKLILELVNNYGLHKNIVLKFSLGREEVIKCLNQSKVNILLSFKEGSNRSLFEAMFCNTPIICISENVGVNKSYVNEFTGLLVPDRFLEISLQWMKENFKKFSPAQWAAQNISPSVSTSKLEKVISDNIVGANAVYGSFLVKTNNPEVSYLHFPCMDHTKYTIELLKIFNVAKDNSSMSYAIQVGELSNIFEIDISKCGSSDA